MGQGQGGTQVGVAPNTTGIPALYRKEGCEGGVAAHTGLVPNASFRAASSPRSLERDGVQEAQAQIEGQPHTHFSPAALQPTSADEGAACRQSHCEQIFC